MRERSIDGSVVDAIVDGLMLVNDGGTLAKANRAVHEIFGYTSPELAGASVHVVVRPSQGGAHPTNGDTRLFAPGDQADGEFTTGPGRHKIGNPHAGLWGLRRVLRESRFTGKTRWVGSGLHDASILASRLGGAIVAFSGGPGQGATFTLSLPSRSRKCRSAGQLRSAPHSLMAWSEAHL